MKKGFIGGLFSRALAMAVKIFGSEDKAAPALAVQDEAKPGNGKLNISYSLDVHKSPDERKAVEQIERLMNKERGSKFIKPSLSVVGRSYNDGYKYN